MLVFGDVERVEQAELVVAEIAKRLSDWRRLPAALAKHQSLVAAFIRASELVQGIADAEFERLGHDGLSIMHDAGNTVLLALARALVASWDNGYGDAEMDMDATSLNLLKQAGAIRTKQAEGYSFYALYPESYIVAARRSSLSSDATVIGIRSVGAGLAALVAAAIGASSVYNLRPVGHPFHRQLAIGEQLKERFCSALGDFAIVDEGPGLSGSSFNSVADWLVAQGVAEERLHFFPSHGGELGPQASAAHRQRWASAKRWMAGFDDVVLHEVMPDRRLETWIAGAVGDLDASLEDVSGGAWRKHRFAAEGDWPPVDAAMERRKFRAWAGGQPWLAKFVGIGAAGEEKLALARTLAEGGFAPAPAGLCHGFLLMPWIEPDRMGGRPPGGRVLDYLAFRASLPASSPGASLSELFTIAEHNVGQHWDAEAAEAMKAALGDPVRFAPVPCITDNRMHLWEWVQGAGGWMKLDSVDHHAAHDLVGCQDIAWDVAGVAVEFGLSAQERNELAEKLGERIGRSVSLDFVAVNELCYLAFQLGLWTMALGRNGTDERPRIEKEIERYAQRLHSTLRLP